MSSLCLSCSSTTRQRDTHKTPCCAAPICAQCIARNPRIVDWMPCLRCGDGVEAVKAPQRRVREDERFVIGDEDEGDEDGPPAYEDVSGCAGIGGETLSGRSESSSINHVPIHHDEPTAKESIHHRIQKGETIRSIAARYAMDPYTLIKLNDLPYTALTTHPTVIHTRKNLLLAPSDLRAGSTRQDDTTDPTSRWAVGDDDDDQRTAERRAKRFQLVTKTPDPLIAKTYLAISDPSSSEIFSFTDADEGKEKPRALTLTGEEAAVARWFDDEAWEARQGGAKTTKGGRGGKWFGKDKDKGKGKWVSRGPDGVARREEKGVKI